MSFALQVLLQLFLVDRSKATRGALEDQVTSTIRVGFLEVTPKTACLDAAVLAHGTLVLLVSAVHHAMPLGAVPVRRLVGTMVALEDLLAFFGYFRGRPFPSLHCTMNFCSVSS